MTHQQDLQTKYLYCIIECPQERTFEGISGIGGADLVYTVVLKDLACVVSASPNVTYESTRQNLLAHEKVIERVMQEIAESATEAQSTQRNILMDTDTHR